MCKACSTPPTDPKAMAAVGRYLPEIRAACKAGRMKGPTKWQKPCGGGKFSDLSGSRAPAWVTNCRASDQGPRMAAVAARPVASMTAAQLKAETNRVLAHLKDERIPDPYHNAWGWLGGMDSAIGGRAVAIAASRR